MGVAAALSSFSEKLKFWAAALSEIFNQPPFGDASLRLSIDTGRLIGDAKLRRPRVTR